MSLFFKKNFLCAVFKVHLPLPYCHTCLVLFESSKIRTDVSVLRAECTALAVTSSCTSAHPRGASYFEEIEPGSHLLSHAVSSIVPSAAQVLTIVFGMGTGVSPERIATRKGVIKFSLGN